MTPDELRRMDNAECIIFEKGLKPIKAAKYYYYKYPTEKIIKPYAVDHNTREEIDRGKWRKYNPYNPYEEEEKPENTKIEQLDDLFQDDDMQPEIPETQNNNNNNNDIEMPMGLALEPTQQTTPPKSKKDIEKEIEAKFDELFGSLNDDVDGN